MRGLPGYKESVAKAWRNPELLIRFHLGSHWVKGMFQESLTWCMWRKTKWFPIKSIILEQIDLIDLSGCGQEIILATAVRHVDTRHILFRAAVFSIKHSKIVKLVTCSGSLFRIDLAGFGPGHFSNKAWWSQKTAQNRTLETSKILEATVGQANHKQSIDFEVHPVVPVLRPFESKNGSANWFNWFGCQLNTFEIFWTETRTLTRSCKADFGGVSLGVSSVSKLILEVFP